MEPGRAWQAMQRPPWRFLAGRWPWLALLYLVLSAVIAIALVPIVVLTFPILPLWALALGALERRRTRLLGFPRQHSGHAVVPAEERHHWLTIRLTEPATWREVLALVVDLVFGGLAVTVLFFETVAILVLGMLAHAGITGPTQMQLIGDTRIVVTPANWWPVVPISFVLLCVLGYVHTLLAVAQASLLRVLCGPRQRELDQNMERILRSRRTLVDSFDVERRRIERDLHDGVQQELVALGAQLGMASLEVEELAARGADTAAIARAVEAAQSQAEHAMATLRDTVHGIHPSVLTDHGLHAALGELAERNPIPVDLHLTTQTRLPASVETAAYYVATEALSNVAKHAGATAIGIRTTVSQNRFTIDITDDGAGGADESRGTGLRGLRERAEALNGHLDIDSPGGGPSVVRMTVPIAEDEAGSDANPAR
jgi:signal transduction histidine kinase